MSAPVPQSGRTDRSFFEELQTKGLPDESTAEPLVDIDTAKHYLAQYGYIDAIKQVGRTTSQPGVQGVSTSHPEVQGVSTSQPQLQEVVTTQPEIAEVSIPQPEVEEVVVTSSQSQVQEVRTSLPRVEDDVSLSDETLRAALMWFQSMADIPQTGELDSTTQAKMTQPRCGFPDNIPSGSSLLNNNRRRRRFLLSGSRWPVKSLTYNVASFPRADLNLSDAEVTSAVRRAFKYWSDASSLSFNETSSATADIQMNFFVGDHGDMSPFHGPGRVLAHAFYPVLGGDLHWDGDETWTVNSSRGRNLLYVTTHELGHALGLGHSYKPNSIMSPFYKKYNPNLKLSQDDVDGIQSIYGPPSSTQTESSAELFVITTKEEVFEQLRTRTDEEAVFSSIIFAIEPSTTSLTPSSTAPSSASSTAPQTSSSTASSTAPPTSFSTAPSSASSVSVMQ